jgi:hypothetical protein
MAALDGNAIAGTLRTVFGTEMTTATGVCAHCGAGRRLGELVVYADAPGVVARCADCGQVLMVIVQRERIACVDVSGFATINIPPGDG